MGGDKGEVLLNNRVKMWRAQESHKRLRSRHSLPTAEAGQTAHASWVNREVTRKAVPAPK